jgi:hypothetical protein
MIMKSINSLMMNRLQMKTTQLCRRSLDAIANVRALIEHEFSLLRQREPRLLRQALNEAEAIAWQTGFPQLVFPSLALEKARAVADWESRQRSIRPTASRGTQGV